MSLYAIVEQIWNNEALLWTLGALSVLSLFASMVLIPFLVVRIPVDYFSEEKRHPLPWAHRHVVIRWIVLVLKNVIGLFFLLLGIGMLFLPGQGLVTMFIGILLLNFPGKYRLERWLVRRPSVRNAVNWLRRRSGRPPLRFDGLE
ncbi:PGPGW domain-containing protein [Methylophaga sp. OBS4]|uniref:PGPGW domain-containing protein n=1 Tax=Methylophaga sp. OBS4 TaxID=2991935 RepID=UPI002250768B|nr:PGPGW domain-containing protein [Methylophaga sp. OBS4]MCX4188178.1 PGPGW domain-containing protein [Methylophaga sp. OBS4]